MLEQKALRLDKNGTEKVPPLLLIYVEGTGPNDCKQTQKILTNTALNWHFSQSF